MYLRRKGTAKPPATNKCVKCTLQQPWTKIYKNDIHALRGAFTVGGQNAQNALLGNELRINHCLCLEG